MPSRGKLADAAMEFPLPHEPAHVAAAQNKQAIEENPNELSRKSASKIGSRISKVAIWTTRSRIVGMPRGRVRPSGLGMCNSLAE